MIDEAGDFAAWVFYTNLCNRLWREFNSKSEGLFEQLMSGGLGYDSFPEALTERRLGWLFALPQSQRILFATQAFYLNWHLAFSTWYQLEEAMVSPETVEGFHMIGFHQSADVIRRAND
ncbi:MAG: hypothetical protein JO112_08185 [Planctomycetes bacterium]|nr:hypothetical protein [Planctomycetota bacterium]